MTPLFLSVAFLLAGGILACLAHPELKGKVAVAGALAAAGTSLPLIVRVLVSGHGETFILRLNAPVGAVRLMLDPLAAWFLLPILLGGFLAALYSLGYMATQTGPNRLSTYYFFLSLLTASMMCVVLIQNTLFFLVAWEIMSVSSFFLVLTEYEKEEVRRAGLYYLTAMQVGAALLVTAFAVSVWKGGSTDMEVLTGIFADRGTPAAGLFLLFFFGFGTKAGFIPFHTWLPVAHPAAPTPVSALMSGVMIKTGIYGILRIVQFYGRPEPGLALTVFLMASATGVWGIMNALARKDIKRLLAYSSIENVGIIGMGIGIGMIGLSCGDEAIAFLGFMGGLLHVFNHFTFKSVLFYGAGAVYLRTHTRNLNRLGGLIRTMPAAGICVLAASIAAAGLPLFSGFVGEFILFLGLIRQINLQNPLLVVTAIAGLGGLAWIGVMAALCFGNAFSTVFLGHPRSGGWESAGNHPRILLAPMLFLVPILPLIGLLPRAVLPFLVPVTGQMVGKTPGEFLPVLREIFGRLSQVSLTLVGIFLALYFLRRILLRNGRVREFRTWDCGYGNPDSRLQYTGRSFASPFLSLIGWAVPVKVRRKHPEGFFPEDAREESRAEDRIESLFIMPILNGLRHFFGLFEWVQSGKTQRYLLYGLIFLVLILAWIFGGPG